MDRSKPKASLRHRPVHRAAPTQKDWGHGHDQRQPPRCRLPSKEGTEGWIVHRTWTIKFPLGGAMKIAGGVQIVRPDPEEQLGVALLDPTRSLLSWGTRRESYRLLARTLGNNLARMLDRCVTPAVRSPGDRFQRHGLRFLRQAAYSTRQAVRPQMSDERGPRRRYPVTTSRQEQRLDQGRPVIPTLIEAASGRCRRSRSTWLRSPPSGRPEALDSIAR